VRLDIAIVMYGRVHWHAASIMPSHRFGAAGVPITPFPNGSKPTSGNFHDARRIGHRSRLIALSANQPQRKKVSRLAKPARGVAGYVEAASSLASSNAVVRLGWLPLDDPV
jgi:hypothetical protein